MINGIFGRPRAGKSYESVVYHIIPAAKDGRKVVTNIPVNKEKIAQFYSQDVADNITVVEANFNQYGMVRPFSVPSDFTRYDWKAENGQGVLFVVDEAHLSIGRDAKKEVLEYLSMHGHYGHDIIILCQSPAKLHKDLKDMVEVCFRCIKKSVFGDDTHYIKKTYHGISGRNSDYIHEEEREYQKQYFQFYQSHTQSSKPVDEAKTKDIKANFIPHRKLSIALIVIGVVFTLYTGKKILIPDSLGLDSSKSVSVPVEVKPSVSSSSVVSNANASPVLPSSKKSSESKKHPFYKVSLHIDSVAEFTLKRYLVKEVYFVAAQNGQPMFTISTKDLRLAGYDVQVFGDCAVLVTYEDYEDWITCDSPRVALAANLPDSTPEQTD
ncbi:zonular occludens toxin [Shewanella mesophila]|uniref:zonular occludens toxin domain-containing protein n=1 Tax=Shewanella mesophila TaxID=2864208 RepID=UPI001C65AC49|nr:zonular occludens toxin domain-containing protein [Shewanella mesophila]QYJ87849.1 zonular occludens toxin [Shewanella mesophila]QYJ87857.1 zonular occludens toxin [Shewanella mesophila]QYJ87865.1 zonular occludens toxin [Shewanella mesophila]